MSANRAMSADAGAATARLTLDPAFRIGRLDRRLFGTFVEHMGRCVYTGVYEPDHPSADEYGFRGDVADLVRELGATVVRYPGGNFVSGYRWEDGIGPREERPRRLDLAWRAVETNEVGLDEFAGWAERTGLELMYAVNLGTRGVAEACAVLEYANHPGGTAWSDRRIANGVEKPHDIRLWCLGNEMDGPWQVGHKTAEEYGRLAAEAARAMRMVDPSIELVACGSSNATMPTFAAWEATVLEHTYDLVDHISLHAYYEEHADDLAGFLASAVDLDRMIDSIVATADHVRARRRSPKRLTLSVDEWNVWYQQHFGGAHAQRWDEAPGLIEDVYDVADAVVVGDLLMTLMRHADRVAVACQAQLVNVIAPILTRPGGPAWRQTIFHPFAHSARLARGDVLRVDPVCPTYDTSAHGEVPVLGAAATHDPETGDAVLFLVNRSSRSLGVSADVRALAGAAVAETALLADEDIRARNTAEDPDRVTPSTVAAAVTDGALRLQLPPVAWAAVRLTTNHRAA